MKVLQSNVNGEYIDGVQTHVAPWHGFFNLGKGENQYLAEATKDNQTTEEEVKEKIEKGEYVPPWEAKTVSTSTTGYDKISTNNTKSSVYFWVEELKNWCCYIYYYEKGFYGDTPEKVIETRESWQNNPDAKNGRPSLGLNGWHLYVWNGIDAFIPITNLKILKKYEIKCLQEPILNSLRTVIVHRGNNNCMKKTNDTHFSWDKFTTRICRGSPQVIIHGIIISSKRNYSINDEENYQTIRCASPGNSVELETDFTGSTPSYLRPMIRQGMPTGCPALWRLSTGELLLCAYMVWGGTCDVNGKEQVNFINEVCRNVFGSGSDKTIKDDWLRYKEPNKDEESASDSDNFSYTKTTLLNTQIEQYNKSTKKDVKISFSVNDVNVSINEKKDDDLISRW